MLDKVWHEDNFELKQNDISDKVLNSNIFLRNKKQRVVLKRQVSTWTNVNAGVPQGFTLAPLLLLIYKNDLADELTSNAQLFADDTLFSVVHNVDKSAAELNNENWEHE